MDTLNGFEPAVFEIAKRVAQIAQTTQTPIVLVEGPAGSGKTTFANLLREALFQAERMAPRVLSMDELYPGWKGLRQGANYLIEHVLSALSMGQAATWQTWDWVLNERGGSDVGNGHRSFEPGGILIVEGCGSLSQASKPLASLSIFIDRPEAARWAAIRGRDGERFDAHWDLWLAQEQEFYRQEGSVGLADYLVTN